MVRREFIRGLLAGGAVMGVSACGGGSGSGISTEAVSGKFKTPLPAPVPAAAPIPAPAPPPVPTLRGVTIEQAQADIAAPIDNAGKFFAVVGAVGAVVTVSNADQFQAAVTQMFDTARNPRALASHQRILCAWNGVSTLSAGPAANVVIGGKLLGTGHLDAGGGLAISAAPGYAPDFANTVMVYGRGIAFHGIGFARKATALERAHAVNAVTLARSNTYPVNAFVAFESCAFGSRRFTAQAPDAGWVNGLGTEGQAADYVGVANCTFIGQQNAAKIVAKALRIDGCDFQAVLKDCITLLGHTFETNYYAHAWISRSTFRNSPDDWDSRSAHSDTIQTGTKADRHLGYRVLVTDVMSHLGRRYSGEKGMGGGTQGFYNDDHLTADNQFVVRRSVFLVTAPHGFCYFSPRASRPSFVDASVFTRAGHVPSAFAPDPLSQDFAVGITGTEPANGPWLLVTDTIAKKSITSETVTVTSVDPRLTSLIAAGERPETIFAGRDFSRGNAAVNGQLNKLGYALPNETGTQARFVADVWANFQPKASAVGKGAPNPTALSWTS